MGDDCRLAGLDHIADDAFAVLVAVLALAVAGDAGGGCDDQFAAVGRKEHDRAADQGQPFFQQFQHFGQHLPLPMLGGQQARNLGQDPQVLLVRADGTETVFGKSHRGEW